jgi:hypothetical protein
MRSRGFFKLEDPFDLLRKLEHDFERLRSNSVDGYAAFDFFVTATHMHEWVRGVGWQWHPPTELRQAAVHKLCGDLGNGAKHFVLHKKFDNATEVREGWVQSGDWVQAGPWIDMVGDLIIRLNESEATTLGASSITALALAEMVLHSWSEELERRSPPIDED